MKHDQPSGKPRSPENKDSQVARISETTYQGFANGSAKSPDTCEVPLGGASALKASVARRSAVSARRRVVRLTPNHLSIPKGGKAILAGLAWPSDESRRADFLQRCGIPRDGLSRKQLCELSQGGGVKIERQLERWGCSTAYQVAWLLDPYVAPMTEQERERARLEAFMGTYGKLTFRELEERKKWQRGSMNGHAAQSAARCTRKEHIRKDAKGMRAMDKNKSKTALARELSCLYRKGEMKYGSSVSTILRVAGDVLEKKNFR
jgi:hypothetical protein